MSEIAVSASQRLALTPKSIWGSPERETFRPLGEWAPTFPTRADVKRSPLYRMDIWLSGRFEGVFEIWASKNGPKSRFFGMANPRFLILF